jgi:beta-lactamase regulating signal transducer with metallopeptidase domain
VNLANLLLAATWKGSLLVALVLLLTLALRGRMPARWAHALLLVALVRLLLPFGPESPVSLFNLAPRDERPVLVSTELSEGTFERVPFRAHIAAPQPPAEDRFPWRNALLGLWAAGSLIAVTRIAMQGRAIRRIVQAAERLPSNSAAAILLDDCREQMGIRRGVTVAASSAVDAPALYGVVRPTLLLPHGFDQTFEVEQLRFVFLHELAHLRRCDVLVNWIAAVVHALHWFNPLVRIAVSRLAEERELACDALALEHLASSERSAYGGTLLQLLDQWRLPPPVPGLVGMTSTHHHVKRRIQMIATFRSESKRAIWMALVLAIAAVSLTDATAGEQQFFKILKEGLSPETEAVMKTFEQKLTFELTGASIEEVLHAVSNKTGITISVAPDAIDDAARAAKFDLKADTIPAHIVLLESLGALDLAVRIDENGARVERLPEGAEPRIALRAAAPGEAADIVTFRHRPVAGEAAEAGEKVVFEKRIHMKDDADMNDLEAGDGVTRRKVTLRGSEGGQAEGTFQLDVHRGDASSSH